MEPFQIIIDQGSLELAQGAITGKIHVSNTKNAFPEPEWNDFVVVILGWWLDAAAQIFDGRKRDGLFQFMDGPFSIAVSSRPGPDLALTLQAGPKRRIVETWTCEAQAVRLELVRSASAVLAECRVNGWKTDDTASLEQGLDLLARSAST
jgi:hypothetical protein